MNLIVFNSIIMGCLTCMAIFLSRIRALKEKQLRAFYLFAGGNLIAMVALDILPESIGEIGYAGMLAFFIIGLIIFNMMHGVIHHNVHKKEDVTYISVGTALVSHGFPEGMALGAAVGTAHGYQRMALILIFLLHILPEMIMFQQALKEREKIRRSSIILASIIIFIPAVLGMLISIKIGAHIGATIGVLSATAAGFIVMLVVKELIFRDNKQLKIHETLIIILGSVTVAVILGI